jgi:heme exporter protein C
MTSTASRLRATPAASLVALAAAAWTIFFYAPTDALQGDVQRIFYLHLASALVAYLCFALVLGGSVAYLARRSPRGDRLARAAAPVGLLFTTVTLVMGSIWARPIWGTWWTWDARLTSTLVLWLIYAGYLLVRKLAAPGASAARLGAVVGIVGFVDVPIVHFSVTWWRTQHPGPVVASTAGPQLPPAMLVTLAVTVVAVLLLGATFVAARWRIESARERLAALRLAAGPPAEEYAGRLGNTPANVT